MRTKFHWTLLAIGLLAACGGKDEAADDTGATGDDDDAPPPSVLRDCDPTPGNICPWAGVGINGFNGDDVHRLDAWFSYPMSVTMSDLGPPIIADWNNHKLRAVLDNPEDGFNTVMGTDFLGDGDPALLDQSAGGAPGETVNLNHPTQQMYFPDHCGTAGGVDLAGKLLSASWHTHKLRIEDLATETVWVWAGGGAGWNAVEFDESADTVKFNQPRQILIDSQCDVYVLDMRNERIRKLDVDSWTVSTIAGSGAKGYAGDGGDALLASFNFPKNANPEPGGYIVLNADETIMYVADSESHVIRAIDLVAGTIELIAGTPLEAGDADGAGTSAKFDFPSSLAIDHATNELFVADSNNHKVKVIDLNTNTVSTFAGTGEASCPISGDVINPQVCDNQHDGGDGGPATEATLYRPFGVDLDLDGNLIIADSYNHRFRIVYR